MRIKDSEECGKSELDLFTIPPTQTAMEEGRWDFIKPFSNFQTGTVTFEIEGDNQCYIDLAQTELMLTCKIYKDNVAINSINSVQRVVKVAEVRDKTSGNVTTAAEWTEHGWLGVVNNLMHSMFSQIQVKIGNTEVENTNSNYSYRAIIENLLCYDQESKETFLRNEMYTKDDAAAMNSATETGNSGMVKRRKIYDDQKCFHMKGKLKSDVFNMNKYMLPQVNMTVILTRSQPSFTFLTSNNDVQANAKYELRIEETALQVRRVKVSKEIALSHAMQLEQTAAKYPIKRVIMRAQNCPSGVANFVLNGIHRGIMPSRVVVGFVNSKGYAGNYSNNPFNFENMDIRNIKLKVASTPLPYSDGITCDFSENKYIEAYDSLFQNIRNMGSHITYEDYKNGYCLFPFDLSPDLVK
jgi:hypothetical protein